jgi:hypothetical protein
MEQGMNNFQKLQTWCNIHNIQFKTNYECPYEEEYYPAVAYMNAYPYGKIWAYINENEETFLNICKEEEGWNVIQVPENWNPNDPLYTPLWRSSVN